MEETSNFVRIRRGLTLPLLLLIAWEASSRFGLVDIRFLPPIEDVILTPAPPDEAALALEDAEPMSRRGTRT